MFNVLVFEKIWLYLIKRKNKDVIDMFIIGLVGEGFGELFLLINKEIDIDVMCIFVNIVVIERYIERKYLSVEVLKLENFD